MAAKRDPAYEGDEPYLWLCYAERDEQNVRPLLRRLLARGCRVWHESGVAGTLSEQERREARRSGAKLLVLYNTREARRDTELKGALLAAQDRGCPIVSIDLDEEDSELSLGLTKGTVHLQRPRSAAAAEAALLRAEGFSQTLIGEPVKIGVDPIRVISRAAFALFALLIAAGAVWYFLRKPPEIEIEAEPEPTDSVVFADPVLTEAVREAIGGGRLTEEALESVEALTLTALPASLSELERLPNLKQLRLTQSAAMAAGDAVETLAQRYELLLIGGGA